MPGCGDMTMNRTIGLVMLAAMLVASAVGCASTNSGPGVTPMVVVPATGPAATAPAGTATTMPAGAAAAMPTGDVMAYVNNQPIAMSRLSEMLVQDYGLAYSQQLVASELVNQEAAKRNIKLTDADLQAENDAVLKRALGELPAPAQRESILANLIRQFGVTQTMWDLVMRRQAILRRIAAEQVTISDDDLKNEFDVQYSRSVTVRDIQTGSAQDAERMLKTLQAIKDPKDVEAAFIDLAKKNSNGYTAVDGGLLPPITAKSEDVLPAFREAALAMTKPGQLAGLVQTGTAFHVIYCVKVEAPKNVKLADVRKGLEASIRDRKTGQLQQDLLQKMIQNARKAGNIRYVNPTLKSLDDDQENSRKASPR